LISTPYPLTGTASAAVVAARRSRAEWVGSGRAPRILRGLTLELTLEKHRHLRPGRTALSLQVEEAIGGPAATKAKAATALPHSESDARAVNG